MSLREQEEQIFQRWAQQRRDFVRDGVVDEAEWMNSSRKILFLMKEVNSKKRSNLDLREFLLKGARSQTWDTVTRWVRAIRALPEELPWKANEDVTEAQRRDVLKSIAVLNVKKSPGGSTANEDEILQVALEDHKFIEEQYLLYDAEIVVLCGGSVGSYYRKRFSLNQGEKWKSSSRGIPFLKTSSGKIIIDYSHPAARVSPYILHYPLLDAIREIQ